MKSHGLILCIDAMYPHKPLFINALVCFFSLDVAKVPLDVANDDRYAHGFVVPMQVDDRR